MLAGALFKLLSMETYLTNLSKHFGNLFMILLLPPIIFESGFNMNKKPFLANFANSIDFCQFAFPCQLWLFRFQFVFAFPISAYFHWLSGRPWDTTLLQLVVPRGRLLSHRASGGVTLLLYPLPPGRTDRRPSVLLACSCPTGLRVG